MSRALRPIRYGVGYWCIRLLLRLSPWPGLPRWQAVGRGVGLFLWLVARHQRRRILEHLRLAFPEASERWCREVARGCAEHLGNLLGEVIWLWAVPRDELLARTDFSGLEHLEACLRSGRGFILVTAHYGNWEWLNLALAARGTPLTMAVRALADPRLEAIARSLRNRFGSTSVQRGGEAGRKLAAACRRGHPIGLAIDQDIDAPGCFVEFFGRPAWTPIGAGLLARRLDRPLVAAFAVRHRPGRMHLCFDQPIEPALASDPAEEARRLTALLTHRIELQIRAHPEQWVWVHRRWRRQPQGDEEVVRWSATMPPHRLC